MTGFGVSLLAFVVAISILVAVHEFGHFWVARKLGIKVLRFSIGFGKPVWSCHFGRDRTEFAIAALPLGGYVKMLDEREAPVAPEERDRAFNHQSLPTRTAVILAGPLFNFIFAVLAYWLMFVSGIPGMKPVVGTVAPQTVAAAAGFIANDEIVRVGDEPVPTWDAATLELLDAALASRRVEIAVRQPDGTGRLLQIDFSKVPDALEKGGLLTNLGLSVQRPHVEAVIDRLVKGGAAQQAGLQPGDRIVAVDGSPVDDWGTWVDTVRAHPEQPLKVVVERSGETVTLDLTPKAVDDKGTTIGQIGAYVRRPPDLGNELRTELRYGPFRAIGKAFNKTGEMTALTLRSLWGMLSGRASVENISGPISIAQYAGYSASIGLASFLKFLAVVSISLGVLNLLPVPVLDGGYLLYYTLEWLRGEPLSETTQQVGQQLGILLLLGLMGIAFYNDLSRLFGA